MTQELEVQTEKLTPVSLLQQAIEKGLDVEQLEKLVGLQERWEENKARKQFFQAFTEFQSKCPEIRKSKQVKFKETEYKYAPLADITRQIAKTLDDCKLSYRWEIQDDEKTIKVTCLISHIEGHTERTTMTANPDTSGSKNAIQARGSAIEYMKRYTLIGALGLSTTDTDTDGMGVSEYDMDKLHKEYMEVYNQIIQIDASLSKYHPDNWKVEPTGKYYVKAISEIRKVLFEFQKKNR